MVKVSEAMRDKEKVLDDIAQLAGGTVSIVSDLGRNIHEEIKSRTDEMAQRLDWVPREDFENLELRVQALEKALEASKKQSKTKK